MAAPRAIAGLVFGGERPTHSRDDHSWPPPGRPNGWQPAIRDNDKVPSDAPDPQILARRSAFLPFSEFQIFQ